MVRDAGNDVQKPLPDSDISMLMKMFQSITAMPKFMEVDVHHKNERLRAWKVAVDIKLAATRPVVVQWFDWSWTVAEQHYQRWLREHVLARSGLRIEMPVPVRYQWIENFFSAQNV